MIPECTNISIDLTNGRIVCEFEHHAPLVIPTDLFTIADFNLVRGAEYRITQYLRDNFGSSHYGSRANQAREHAKTLAHRNGLVRTKHKIKHNNTIQQNQTHTNTPTRLTGGVPNT